MTTDLDRLIEAVEEGTPDNFGAVKPGHPIMRGYAENAYNGSLDGAVTVLEALLPGWDWWVNSRHYWDKSEGPLALIKTGQPGIDLKVVDAKSDNPARALLLATLRAYRSTREGG